jgi:hypothetical protein
MQSRTRLGEILVDRGVLTAQQLDAALKEQRRCGERLGQVLIRLDILEPEQLSSALTEQTRRWFAAGLTFGFLAMQPGAVLARTTTAELSVSVQVLATGTVAVQALQSASAGAANGNLSASCGNEPLMRVIYQRAHLEAQPASAVVSSSFVPAPPAYKLSLQPLSQTLVPCGSAQKTVGLAVPAVSLQGDQMNIEIAY